MKQTIRVLHLTPSLAREHGGPTEAVLGMVKALRTRSLNVTIVSSDDDLGGHLAVPLNSWTEYEGIPTFFIRRIGSRQHTLSGFTFAPGFVPWLWHEIANYDIIHIHTVFSFPANAAMLIARLRRKPYVVRPVGQLCAWSLTIRSRMKRAQLATLGRRNLNGAAFLHATSQKEADETRLIGLKPPIRVLPLGVDIPERMCKEKLSLRAELRLPAHRKLGLFLSRIHEGKGLDTLLEAMALASADFDLAIAGDGDRPYVEKMRAVAAQLELTSRVHWLGFVKGKRKADVLESSDFFVLPSHSENFGIAAIEALAAGLVIIISPQAGAAAEMSASDGVHVVPVDRAALGAVLKKVSETENFGSEAREFRRSIAAERFSWSSAGHKMAAAYEETLRGYGR